MTCRGVGGLDALLAGTAVQVPKHGSLPDGCNSQPAPAHPSCPHVEPVRPCAPLCSSRVLNALAAHPNVKGVGGAQAKNTRPQATASESSKARASVHFNLKPRKAGPTYTCSPDVQPVQDQGAGHGAATAQAPAHVPGSPRDTAYQGQFSTQAEVLLRAARNYHAPESPPKPSSYPGVRPMRPAKPTTAQQQLAAQELLLPMRAQLAVQCSASVAQPLTQALAAAHIGPASRAPGSPTKQWHAVAPPSHPPLHNINSGPVHAVASNSSGVHAGAAHDAHTYAFGPAPGFPMPACKDKAAGSCASNQCTNSIQQAEGESSSVDNNGATAGLSGSSHTCDLGAQPSFAEYAQPQQPQHRPGAAAGAAVPDTTGIQEQAAAPQGACKLNPPASACVSHAFQHPQALNSGGGLGSNARPLGPAQLSASRWLQSSEGTAAAGPARSTIPTAHVQTQPPAVVPVLDGTAGMVQAAPLSTAMVQQYTAAEPVQRSVVVSPAKSVRSVSNAAGAAKSSAAQLPSRAALAAAARARLAQQSRAGGTAVAALATDSQAQHPGLDTADDATFEQVHVLLSSINLPGMTTGRSASGWTSPSRQPSARLASLADPVLLATMPLSPTRKGADKAAAPPSIHSLADAGTIQALATTAGSATPVTHLQSNTSDLAGLQRQAAPVVLQAVTGGNTSMQLQTTAAVDGAASKGYSVGGASQHRPRVLDPVTGRPCPRVAIQYPGALDADYQSSSAQAGLPLQGLQKMGRALRVDVALSRGMDTGRLLYNAAREQAMTTKLHMVQACEALDLQPSSSMLPGLQHNEIQDDVGHQDEADAVPQALWLLPPRLVRLKALSCLVKSHNAVPSDQLLKLHQQLRKAKRDVHYSKALDMGTKMGMSRMQLRRLQAKAPAPVGDATFTTTLLVGMVNRLRQQAVLRVLQHAVANRRQLVSLMDHAEGVPCSMQLQSLMLQWHQVAAARGVVRRAIMQHRHSWLVHHVHHMLGMWFVWTKYKRQLHHTSAVATHLHTRRKMHSTLAWWQTYTCYNVSLQNTCRQIVRRKARRMLRAWSQAAVHQAAGRRRTLLAVAWHVRRVMVSALAHWRINHLHVYSKRVWSKAVASWHNIQVKGRVLRCWHFLAQRAAVVIARATQQHQQSKGMVVLPITDVPAPLGYGIHRAAQHALSTAVFLIEAAADEIHHLRAFCRFTAADDDSQQRSDAPATDGLATLQQLLGNAGGRNLQHHCEGEPGGLYSALLLAAGGKHIKPHVTSSQRSSGHTDTSVMVQEPVTWAPGPALTGTVGNCGAMSEAASATQVAAAIAARLQATSGHQSMFSAPAATMPAAPHRLSDHAAVAPAAPQVTFSSLIEDGTMWPAGCMIASGGAVGLAEAATEQANLLLNQWQFKHEVSYMLQQLHAAVTKQQLCDQRKQTEQACAQALMEELRVQEADAQAELSTKLQLLPAACAPAEESKARMEAIQAESTQLQQAVQELHLQLAQHADSRAKAEEQSKKVHDCEVAEKEAAGALAVAQAALYEAHQKQAAAEHEQGQCRMALAGAQQRVTEAMQLSSELAQSVQEVTALAERVPPHQARQHVHALEQAHMRLSQAQVMVDMAQAEVARLESACTACDEAAACACGVVKQCETALQPKLQALQHAKDALADIKAQDPTYGQQSAVELQAAILQTEQGLVEVNEKVTACTDKLSTATAEHEAAERQARLMQMEVDAHSSRVKQAQDDQDSLQSLLQSRLLPLHSAHAHAATTAVQLRAQLGAYSPKLVQAVAALLDEKQQQQHKVPHATAGGVHVAGGGVLPPIGQLRYVPVGPQGVLQLPTALATTCQTDTAGSQGYMSSQPGRALPLGAAGLPLHLLQTAAPNPVPAAKPADQPPCRHQDPVHQQLHKGHKGRSRSPTQAPHLQLSRHAHMGQNAEGLLYRGAHLGKAHAAAVLHHSRNDRDVSPGRQDKPWQESLCLEKYSPGREGAGPWYPPGVADRPPSPTCPAYMGEKHELDETLSLTYVGAACPGVQTTSFYPEAAREGYVQQGMLRINEAQQGMCQEGQHGPSQQQPGTEFSATLAALSCAARQAGIPLSLSDLCSVWSSESGSRTTAPAPSPPKSGPRAQRVELQQQQQQQQQQEQHQRHQQRHHKYVDKTMSQGLRSMSIPPLAQDPAGTLVSMLQELPGAVVQDKHRLTRRITQSAEGVGVSTTGTTGPVHSQMVPLCAALTLQSPKRTRQPVTSGQLQPQSGAQLAAVRLSTQPDHLNWQAPTACDEKLPTTTSEQLTAQSNIGRQLKGGAVGASTEDMAGVQLDMTPAVDADIQNGVGVEPKQTQAVSAQGKEMPEITASKVSAEDPRLCTLHKATSACSGPDATHQSGPWHPHTAEILGQLGYVEQQLSDPLTGLLLQQADSCLSYTGTAAAGSAGHLPTTAKQRTEPAPRVVQHYMQVLMPDYHSDDVWSCTSESGSLCAAEYSNEYGVVVPGADVSAHTVAQQGVSCTVSLGRGAWTEARSSYGPSRVVLRVLCWRAHRQLQVALMWLQLHARAALTQQQMAAHRCWQGRLHRAFSTWACNSQAMVTEAALMTRSAQMEHYFTRWSAWSSRCVRQHQRLDRYLKQGRQRQLQHVLGAFRARVAHKAWRASCLTTFRDRQLRHMLHLWRGKVEARQLVVRVLLLAEQLWEERDAALLYGRQFQLLHHVLMRWLDFKDMRHLARHEKQLAHAADVHWHTRLMVRCFACWQSAVVLSWQQLWLQHIGGRLLSAWREIASSSAAVKAHASRHAIRKHLRRLGYHTELCVYLRHLQLRALLAWSYPWTVARDQYAARTQHKVVHALRAEVLKFKYLVREHQQQWAPQHQRAVLQAWKGFVDHQSHLCDTMTALHRRHLSRSVLLRWALLAKVGLCRAPSYAAAVVEVNPAGQQAGVEGTHCSDAQVRLVKSTATDTQEAAVLQTGGDHHLYVAVANALAQAAPAAIVMPAVEAAAATIVVPVTSAIELPAATAAGEAGATAPLAAAAAAAAAGTAVPLTLELPSSTMTASSQHHAVPPVIAPGPQHKEGAHQNLAQQHAQQQHVLVEHLVWVPGSQISCCEMAETRLDMCGDQPHSLAPQPGLEHVQPQQPHQQQAQQQELQHQEEGEGSALAPIHQGLPAALQSPAIDEEQHSCVISLADLSCYTQSVATVSGGSCASPCSHSCTEPPGRCTDTAGLQQVPPSHGVQHSRHPLQATLEAPAAQGIAADAALHKGPRCTIQSSKGVVQGDADQGVSTASPSAARNALFAEEEADGTASAWSGAGLRGLHGSTQRPGSPHGPVWLLQAADCGHGISNAAACQPTDCRADTVALQSSVPAIATISEPARQEAMMHLCTEWHRLWLLRACLWAWWDLTNSSHQQQQQHKTTTQYWASHKAMHPAADSVAHQRTGHQVAASLSAGGRASSGLQVALQRASGRPKVKKARSKTKGVCGAVDKAAQCLSSMGLQVPGEPSIMQEHQQVTTLQQDIMYHAGTSASDHTAARQIVPAAMAVPSSLSTGPVKHLQSHQQGRGQGLGALAFGSRPVHVQQPINRATSRTCLWQPYPAPAAAFMPPLAAGMMIGGAAGRNVQ